MIFDIILVFLAYMVSIVLLAVVYWQLYIRSPENFVFQSDILAKRKINAIDDMEKKLANRHSELLVVQEALNHIEMGNSTLEKFRPPTLISISSAQAIVELGQWRLVINRIQLVGGIAGPMGRTCSLAIKDQEVVLAETTLLGGDLDFQDIEKPDEWRKLLNKWQRDIEQRIEAKQEWFNRNPQARPVWSYLDFVYFSVVSQTTLGYGDILPNSTRVRMLVVFQIIMAYMLLIVVLNIVVGA